MKVTQTEATEPRQTHCTHVAYSDEAYHTEGRFRSIGMVSLAVEHAFEFEKEIQALLADSKLSGEFKWKDLGSAKRRFAAIKLLNWTIAKVLQPSLRVDVLVWDIEDGRHDVDGRDDTENLKRMYHHIYKNVLVHRWPDDAVWSMFPDENDAIDWGKQRQILEYTSIHTVVAKKDLFNRNESMSFAQRYEIEDISEVESHRSPLCQLADLFAGLGVYSRAKFEDYQAWANSVSDQMSLFLETSQQNWSKTDLERFQVLRYFDGARQKVPTKPAFCSSRGLRTYDPCSPINFWWYKPQHESDKAPTRERTST